MVSGLTWRRTRNLSPSTRGSLRVATRVPTTFARSIAGPRLLAASRVDLLLHLGLAAQREDEVHVDVRAGDDVRGDDLADAGGAVLPGLDRRLHRGDVAADDGGDVP